MEKEEKQQKFGFFFGFLTDCKNWVKQIMPHVKNNSKNPHGKEKQARAVDVCGERRYNKNPEKKPDGFIREFENDEACGRVERRPQRIKKETG